MDSSLIKAEALRTIPIEGFAVNAVSAFGNVDLLERRKLAVFCSVTCPASLILQAHDLAKNLAAQDVTLLSSFHSPVEKEMLRVLLRGKVALGFGVARGLEGMRIGLKLREALTAQRLVFLSACTKEKRASTKIAQLRNELLAHMADEVVLIHAAPESKTLELAKQVQLSGKPLYCLEHAANDAVIASSGCAKLPFRG